MKTTNDVTCVGVSGQDITALTETISEIQTNVAARVCNGYMQYTVANNTTLDALLSTINSNYIRAYLSFAAPVIMQASSGTYENISRISVVKVTTAPLYLLTLYTTGSTENSYNVSFLSVTTTSCIFPSAGSVWVYMSVDYLSE